MRSMSLIRFYTIGQQAYQAFSSSLSSDNRITERRRHSLPPKETGMEHAADTKAVWLHESAPEGLLEKHQAEDRQHVRDILDKARSLSRLSLEDVAGLMVVHSQDLLDELFHTAKSVKEEIYGNRIVLFAPLYISNLCSNECLYCAFRRSNKEAIRRALNPDEIWQETKILLRQGHKREPRPPVRRGFPPPEGTEHRYVPAFSGNLPSADLRQGSPCRAQEGP